MTAGHPREPAGKPRSVAGRGEPLALDGDEGLPGAVVAEASAPQVEVLVDRTVVAQGRRLGHAMRAALPQAGA